MNLFVEQQSCEESDKRSLYPRLAEDEEQQEQNAVCSSYNRECCGHTDILSKPISQGKGEKHQHGYDDQKE